MSRLSIRRSAPLARDGLDAGTNWRPAGSFQSWSNHLVRAACATSAGAPSQYALQLEDFEWPACSTSSGSPRRATATREAAKRSRFRQ